MCLCTECYFFKIGMLQRNVCSKLSKDENGCKKKIVDKIAMLLALTSLPVILEL